MSIIVYAGANAAAHYIRPCPLISISWNSSASKFANAGGKYNITLTGTILDSEGSPFTDESFQLVGNTRPLGEIIPTNQSLRGILAKQRALVNLFSHPNNKIELLSVDGSDPVITFYPKLNSINFDQGVWVNTCQYTIELEAGVLLKNDSIIINAENYGAPSGVTIDQYLATHGGFIEDFSENWSIEAEDGNGNTYIPTNKNNHSIRTYRITRSITATGSRQPNTPFNLRDNANYPDHPTTAAMQAKQYVLKYLERTGPENYYSLQYPGLGWGDYIASGTINLAKNLFNGYNHARTESIDTVAGTFSLNDIWLLSSGTAYENYNASISSSITDPISTISMQGTIKGLSVSPASGNMYGGNDMSIVNTAYENAIQKYYEITNNGNFGPLCHIYKRIQNLTDIPVNPTPLSVSLGTNEFTGEISYNLEYDTRPPNVVSGALSENISVSDTYPGDIFAVIPVIGRATGPILQYIGGRTEYQRSLSIDLVMDRKYYPSGADPNIISIRNFGILSKPSLVEPFRTQINSIISAYSPAQEAGIRKYFLSPPTETWDAKTGNYSINLNWTYELNR